MTTTAKRSKQNSRENNTATYCHGRARQQPSFRLTPLVRRRVDLLLLLNANLSQKQSQVTVSAMCLGRILYVVQLHGERTLVTEPCPTQLRTNSRQDDFEAPNCGELFHIGHSFDRTLTSRPSLCHKLSTIVPCKCCPEWVPA